MVLTERQAYLLVSLLLDSLKMNVVGYLSTTTEFRTELLNEIINQQTSTPIQLRKQEEN